MEVEKEEPIFASEQNNGVYPPGFLKANWVTFILAVLFNLVIIGIVANQTIHIILIVLFLYWLCITVLVGGYFPHFFLFANQYFSLGSLLTTGLIRLLIYGKERCSTYTVLARREHLELIESHQRKYSWKSWRDSFHTYHACGWSSLHNRKK